LRHLSPADPLTFFTLARPRPTLFPYTTLFRSHSSQNARRASARADGHHRRDRRQQMVAGDRGDRRRVKPASSTSRISNYVRCQIDRESTRLNSSHVKNSYAVFCFEQKKQLAAK